MKKKIFEQPFIGIENESGIEIIYSNTGAFSTILQIVNIAPQYCADTHYYEDYHRFFGQLIKLLGDGHIVQKTDIISSQKFSRNSDKDDYLTRKYFEHFEGRLYKKIQTYLTITREGPKARFFSYDPRALKEFTDKVNKIKDIADNQKIGCSLLNRKEIDLLHNRFRAFNFCDNLFSIGNFSCDEKGIYYADRTVKSLSLIDIDEANLPSSVTTYTRNQEMGEDFPVDNLAFLLNTNAEVLLYNQIIKIPDQRKIKTDLELKKKRHSSMPDPANMLSVNDIDAMFLDIAQNNELLVYSHFNVLVCDKPEKIEKTVNQIENNLFSIGIIPGKNTYNQLELYRSAIPGNAEELKTYDLFLTSRPAAVCFLFKERLTVTEDSDYQLWFTDRQGIPIGIDTSELPLYTNRISNRNRFILGPSGSGKSFFTNSYVKQCYLLGADIVLVDTGNSYSGLCTYVGGKLIIHREDKPITMNPFNIEQEENTEEKRQLLTSLIVLIWKGVNGVLSQVEEDVVTKCVTNYFHDYFYGGRQAVSRLKFDTFFEFSCSEIEKMLLNEKIRFDIDEYRFILKKFYKGGIYQRVLNEEVDNTLFNERFIVFEIDNIKEHKLLFPVTTLIIMDVFIQKMRYKKNKKVLIIEEAWKAIASPMMAGYILYLYKTVRKFAGEAIVVTQELSDIVGNEIVKNSIINNSDTICLLDQTKFKDSFKEIAELLSLNQVEQNKIFTINQLDNKENRNRFKEVYIKRGATGEVYGVEVPLEEYLTYTTERPEKDAFQIYLQFFSSYEKAMDSFVYDFQSSNLKLPEFVKIINKSESVFQHNLPVEAL
ncbi:MAG TPA: TraG family conjugative transposon ATPase [Arachidicoccus soli]|uniref:TraG family conjugative transposon ATPase n=1 Tax=Arachidicoccus soli TaxID=2341117 RepID=A0A386HST1_9BACT|nr:TraG family conjugative transposon ATPase [Arachidicoccus soli]AYD49038.1 TraG family conjugative transposon ATPase [Arachidicoccus soli]HEU0227930.1 TraG family conjugative transposon ATPase [Arachidicoccus soli]